MAEYKMPKYAFKPPTAEDCFRSVAELSYKSPVETVSKGLKLQMEDDIMTVTHSYGIKVDRDELVKALRYDRDQYKQGYADACMDRKGRIKTEIAGEIFEEIENKIKEDLNGIREHIDGITDPDAIDGQYETISALEWVLESVAELKKKYTEQCPKCKRFVGCECFSGQTCDEYEEGEK